MGPFHRVWLVGGWVSYQVGLGAVRKLKRKGGQSFNFLRVECAPSSTRVRGGGQSQILKVGSIQRFMEGRVPY